MAVAVPVVQRAPAANANVEPFRLAAAKMVADHTGIVRLGRPWRTVRL
jgi:hypothetical protein